MPTDKDIKLLWGKAQAKCSHCYKDLIHIDDLTVIGDMAHIIAKKQGGARGDQIIDSSKRNAYENLILLCLECHKIFDDNPKIYTVQKIKQIKNEHEEKIKQGTSSTSLSSWPELAEASLRILDENKIILDQYGPNSQTAMRNPTSDAAKLWNIRKKAKIIPNNNKIIALFELNDNLLDSRKRCIFIKFREHAYAFERNTDQTLDSETVPMFPNEFREILTTR